MQDGREITVQPVPDASEDMLKRSGINLDYQALDWGTVTQRRNNAGPPGQGGWNAHCTYTAGYDLMNEKGWQRMSPYTVPMLMPNGSAGWRIGGSTRA